MVVNIVPKNDAPVFDTSETRVLRVVQVNITCFYYFSMAVLE